MKLMGDTALPSYTSLSPINIRRAMTSDSTGMAQVHLLSWQHLYSEVSPASSLSIPSLERGTRMWTRAIEKQSQQIFVAERDAEIVGFSVCGASRDPDAKLSELEIWAIHVAPKFFRTGVGCALWLASHAEMRARGASKVTLWLLTANHRALRFYLAAGFAPEPEWKRDVKVGGISIEAVRYAQAIAG